MGWTQDNPEVAFNTWLRKKIETDNQSKRRKTESKRVLAVKLGRSVAARERLRA